MDANNYDNPLKDSPQSKKIVNYLTGAVAHQEPLEFEWKATICPIFCKRERPQEERLSQKGNEQVSMSLDFVSLHQLRHQMNLISKLFLTENQRKLLKYQRSMMINESSDENGNGDLTNHKYMPSHGNFNDFKEFCTQLVKEDQLS